MSYCDNIFSYKRRSTLTVKVGDVMIGSSSPVVLQSMGVVSTNDIEGAQKQTISLALSGAELVRFTAQGVKEAENLALIRCGVREAGCSVPLVADIHFNAEAAYVSARNVEKVRINPGNFSREEVLEERFKSLIDICVEHKTALRIGVNHGSLSARMVEKYGDTVEGMVASALEFLLLAEKYQFRDIVVSMKSSNTLVMLRAYRALAAELLQRGMLYPLHLGVTEAGSGVQGRTRSAVGIGALLADGVGDTIRVSLTESPESEVPFARLLVDYVNTNIANAEPVKIDDELLSSLASEFNPYESAGAGVPFLHDEQELGAYVEIDSSNFLSADYSSATVLINEPNFHARRLILLWLKKYHSALRVVLKGSYSLGRDSFIVAAGVDFGAFLLDGFADGVWIENAAMAEGEVREIVLDLLQATRRRVSSPEYISCPGCGRTLYDIQAVLQQVKERTTGLKNIKLAVMGCIVNGPGEMADADYGYVGAAKDKVTLYKAGEIYRKNIAQEEALDALVELLKENNEFID